MASTDRSGERRFSKSSRITNIEPKIDDVALFRNDMPGNAERMRDARHLRGDLCVRAVISRVRSIDAASGNCTLTIR